VTIMSFDPASANVGGEETTSSITRIYEEVIVQGPE